MRGDGGGREKGHGDEELEKRGENLIAVRLA